MFAAVAEAARRRNERVAAQGVASPSSPLPEIPVVQSAPDPMNIAQLVAEQARRRAARVSSEGVRAPRPLAPREPTTEDAVRAAITARRGGIAGVSTDNPLLGAMLDRVVQVGEGDEEENGTEAEDDPMWDV